MNSSRITAYLLTLLIAIGAVASSLANAEFENCPENASCVADSPYFGWLENDADANDLDSLSCGSVRPEFSLGDSHLCCALFLQLDASLHSQSLIRAPPLSV